MKQVMQIEKNIVRNGIWTHAHIRGPDLESGALDTITAEESSLVLLNGVLTLETKGQSKQQAIVIVSYAMLRVQQLYTMAEILLCG